WREGRPGRRVPPAQRRRPARRLRGDATLLRDRLAGGAGRLRDLDRRQPATYPPLPSGEREENTRGDPRMSKHPGTALRVKVFADGASIDSMRQLAEDGFVKGFTTNPTLMRQGG